MELLGWVLDGWLSAFPLLDKKSRPVYAYMIPFEEEASEEA
jgi:hypothetical protein